jgi:hypothetical protein
VPSSKGGKVQVQIDDSPAETRTSFFGYGDAECAPNELFSVNSLSDTTHKITLTNGEAGVGTGGATLEFHSIKYVLLYDGCWHDH